MAQKTAAGEYLSISIQAAKAAGDALTDAQAAAEAGDVPAAQAAAKRAEEESVIAEQAWEALEKYRKGIATEKTAKALTNRDAAADNARLAKDFVKTARRKAKEMAKAEPAVYDQMADDVAEVKAGFEILAPMVEAADAANAEPVEMPEPALEGEILEAEPVTGDGMPPALDLDALAIPDMTGEFDAAEGKADFVAEAQKAAEAAELHANSAREFAEDGDSSGARVRASLATGAANRARNAARAAREDGLDGAEDAQGYADMAAEYRDAARGHVQAAEARAAEAAEAAEAARADAEPVDVEPAEANRPAEDVQPDPVLAEALAEIADDSPQAAPEAPEAAEDVPQAPEAVPDAQAAPEGTGATYGPELGARLLTPEEQAALWVAPEESPEPDRLAEARELAGPAIGEQAALWLDPAGLAERLATIAQDAAAAAVYWSGKGNADAARKLAVKAGNAAQAATDCATEGEPDAGVIEPHARRARAWAAAARKAHEQMPNPAAG